MPCCSCPQVALRRSLQSPRVFLRFDSVATTHFDEHLANKLSPSRDGDFTPNERVVKQVDTGVEKRIMLPVTYSLAGAAAEAIKAAVPGTQAAVLARKSVLAEARIGSWCIKHPEEPWGMLDPFGEDSSLAPAPEISEPSS